ncbi:alpha/beta hydrolase [Streptomyces sp. NBC_00199]|uniref:alpha/beta hydrolase n=1 Tax=Streptomyces sp. NBC_00199 TaxID=2975678 RepID=UPI002B1E445F|nr:alpha/beta hydrolase [Streptomyces sp. NBC_00199]
MRQTHPGAAGATHADTHLPALMVNATGDPRTTYADATAMHRAWPGSRLVTVTGSDRHGLYGAYGDDCADRTVNAYLRTGRLPAADVICAAPGPSAPRRHPGRARTLRLGRTTVIARRRGKGTSTGRPDAVGVSPERRS